MGITGATGIQVTTINPLNVKVGLAPYPTSNPIANNYNINPNSYYTIVTDGYGRSIVDISSVHLTSITPLTYTTSSFNDAFNVKYTYYDFYDTTQTIYFTVNSLGYSNGIVSLLLVGGGGGGSGYNDIQKLPANTGYPTGNGGASGGQVLLVDNFKLQQGATYTITIGAGGSGGAKNTSGSNGGSTTFSNYNSGSPIKIFEAGGGVGSVLYDNVTPAYGISGECIFPILNGSLLTSSGAGSACSVNGSVVTVNPPGAGYSISYGTAIAPYVNSNVPPITPGYNPGPVVWSYGNFGGSCDGSGNAGGGGGAGGAGAAGYYGVNSQYPGQGLVDNGGNGGGELFVYFTSAAYPVSSLTNPLNRGGLGGGAGGLPILNQYGSYAFPGLAGGINTGTSSNGVVLTTAGAPGTGCAGGSTPSSLSGSDAGQPGGSGRFILRFLSYT
jgi:hypothetical protein